MRNSFYSLGLYCTEILYYRDFCDASKVSACFWLMKVNRDGRCEFPCEIITDKVH